MESGIYSLRVNRRILNLKNALFCFFYSAFKPPILQVFEKLFSVSVVFKYVFLVIAPVDYMIKSAGIFNPQRSGHLFCLYFIFGRFFRWDFYMERKWKCQYLVDI